MYFRYACAASGLSCFVRSAETISHNLGAMHICVTWCELFVLPAQLSVREVHALPVEADMRRCGGLNISLRNRGLGSGGIQWQAPIKNKPLDMYAWLQSTC